MLLTAIAMLFTLGVQGAWGAAPTALSYKSIPTTTLIYTSPANLAALDYVQDGTGAKTYSGVSSRGNAINPANEEDNTYDIGSTGTFLKAAETAKEVLMYVTNVSSIDVYVKSNSTTGRTANFVATPSDGSGNVSGSVEFTSGTSSKKSLTLDPSKSYTVAFNATNDVTLYAVRLNVIGSKEVASVSNVLTNLKIEGAAISASDLNNLISSKTYSDATAYNYLPTVKYSVTTTTNYTDGTDDGGVTVDTDVLASESNGSYSAKFKVGTDNYSISFPNINLLQCYALSENEIELPIQEFDIKKQGYLTASTNNWSSNYYNMSTTDRCVTIKVSGVEKFALKVKNSTAGRTYDVYLGDKKLGTVTHPGKVDNSDVVLSDVFETGSTSEVTIKLQGTGSSVYPHSIILYAPSSTPDPTPTVIPFSMAEEATTAAAHYPTEWEAGHEVALPQLPEFTAENTFYINAAAYGASTESTDNTAAIQAALNAVPAEGGMVVVPAGTWLSGPLTIKSKTVLHLKDGAMLKLLPFAGVNVVPTAGSGKYPVNNSETQDKFTYKMFLSCADNATDIVVEGEGDGSIIEGQGGDWWPHRNSMGTRPPLIRFQKGSRFLFRNFKLQNSPGTNLALSNSNGASDFTVHNVTIKNPSSIQSEATTDGYTEVSHNTDGIPVWGARVNIYDCLIDTGDDNIVFDSDSQYGHVWNCNFKRGHGASFGSYTERLHHIIYEGITFNGTSAGFRIKTQRGRSGNDQDGTNTNGSVHDIICRNAEMTNVTEPIVLTTHYDQEVDDPEHFASAAVTYQTPEYKDFLFKDITVNSIGNCYSGFNRQRPIYIYGLPEQYIHDITFDNVKITGANTAYLAYCSDIHFTNGTTITNTANPTSVVGTTYTPYEATWTGSLLPSDLAIADGMGTITMSVGDEDKALVKGTDYTTSSEGEVTLSSNKEEVVNIVNGKIHAVGAGIAKVTISQAELAANGIYGAGEKEVTVNVTAAPAIKTIYSWESPEGTVSQTGGTIEYVNGDGDRLNFANGNYHTICLNGKKANLNDETASANAGHMVITFNDCLKANDKIALTYYYTNDATKSVSAYLLFDKGGEASTEDCNANIKVADTTPETVYVIVPQAADGSKKLTLTRDHAGTNLFITKIEIKGNRAALATSDLAVADGKETIEMTVGDDDKALVKDTDYTTSSEGTVTLSSSDTSVATIVDGKIHAVAAGTATITISQAAGAIFDAGTAEVTLNVAAGAGPTYPITAKWDFQHGIPSTITSVDINGTTGTVASDLAGIELAVDATTGKLTRRTSDAQYNTGAIIRVPVTSKYDEVTIVSYPNYHFYTINGIAASADSETIKAGDTGKEHGYVEIIATNTAYLYSISVLQQGEGYAPAVSWDPEWDDTNNRWVVKKSATDDATENAKGLTEALKYLNVAANVEGKNKTLYIPNGTYDLGETALTSVPADFHIIGESQDGVIIKNQLPFESIKYTATLKITGANVILENMTIKCRATYGKEKKDDAGTIQDSTAERGVCVQDCGNGTHYINVTLDGLQDTYYSNGAAGMTATFDNCIVRGNVDFFCGSGDITVNNSHLQIVSTHGSGGTAVICAPATYTTETQGYQFNNCIVEAATSDVDCLVSGHSTNQKFALARGWYAGNGGTDRTPRVTFKDTEFEIKPKENWTTMSDSQPGGAPVFNIVNTGVQFSDEAMVINKTNKPFAYATAKDRTNSSSVSASNITGGGEYDLEKIMELMGTEGTDYTVGTTKIINGHKAIVLKSANTTENGKEKRVAMDQTIIDAINNNDIIVLDGAGYSDFVVKSVMTFRKVEDKTVVGINGARLCTEWYLTDYFKSILENVPTSSGTGVNSASTAEGTGGDLYDKDGKLIEHIKEEGEYLTRKNLYDAVGNEDYRYSGIFYLGACKNWIIRNLKLVGPGSLDCAGYDLMAIIDSDNGTKFSDHMWVDHCEFIDGMDGNFDITNGSDFVTVSWCKFYYTDRSYAHQNTNLVGSSDDKKAMDGGKLNITFAYNEWGANCRARMPMARYGRIHMLNNYYNCAGNSEYAMNPRIESEFLVEGNYWERGVRRAYNPNGQAAVTWGNNNYYADNAADKAGSSMGSTVTVPYQYSSLMLDPHKVPEVLTLNGGAKLYQKPYFTTNLGVADNTPDTPELQHNAELTEELKADGLVFSVWAENAHTFQWYKQDIDLEGNAGDWVMIEGENRNTYTFKPVTGVQFNIKCKAFGVSGESTSDILKVNIDGLAAPYYLGGMPDDGDTQVVYTGSPMTFTANFKDAQGYQWYKSATEDRVGATAIVGATSNTYTYDPAQAEIFYLFCAASNSNGKGDGYSDVVKVKGIKRDLKFHMYGYFVQEENDGKGKNHVTTTGGTTTTANPCEGKETKCAITENAANNYPGLCFQTGKSDGCSHNGFVAGTYAKFSPTSAIAVGDVITVKITQSGSSSPADNYGFYLCTEGTKTEENLVKKISVPNTVSKGLLEVTLTESEVAKLAGKTDFYLIPFVPDYNKKICINDVLVYNGETKPVDDPVITKDLNETYETGKNTTLNLSIEAEDAASYQWYSNTVQSTEGATLIEGATSATYAYPTDKVSTKYVYCVVTGSKLGSAPVNSTIAKVSVVDGATATITYATANIKADGTGVSDPDGIMSEISVKLEGDKYSWDTSFSNNKNDDNTTYACIKASATVPENADFVTFTITPENGKMLIADELSFGVCRVGTDNGDLKVYANGALLTEASGKTVVKPGRNSDGKKQDGYVFSYSLKDYSITETEPLTIKLNLYGSINGKTWGIADLKVTGIVKDYVITNVSNPKSEKGTWDEENEKWNYTLSCASMDFAKLNYQIGEESVQSNQTNPVSIKVAPGETFKFWGSDPREGDEHLENSEVITEEAAAKPATATPNVTLSNYNVATHKYTLTISGQDAEATVYYTTDGSDPATSDTKQTYSAELALDPATTVKAIAVRNHYASSPVLETLAPAVNVGVAETFKTTGSGSADAEASGKDNVLVSGTINGANISGIDGATGLKYTTSREVTVTGSTKVKGIQIDVHDGFVITEVHVNNAYSNDKSKSTKITAVYVDGVKLDGFEAKELPASGSGSIKFAIEGITAKNNIILETSYDTDNVNQARAAISLVYEFVDTPVGVTITDSKNSEDIITLAGDYLEAFKSSHEYTVDVNKVYAEDPIVKIITQKGYEYIVPAGEIETDGDKLTHFTKSFVGVTYTVKAKVNAVKSPNIEIANDMSLKGGYKVTLKYSEESGTVPYIKVDDGEWEQYDPNKEYFALENVQSKMLYGTELENETVAREASCPDNSYEAGKPFAVYLYVNGYSDNQVGTHAYNNESFKTDKIYQAVANQFNVIPLAVNNSDAILEKRSDITDAKLVVITETLGGSGSVEIVGVGNKSNMMALTLKRDVLDRTNVLNLKMFLNGSSSANNQRWQWAQPRAMTSEITSIMPCTPDGGGMYEIFGNATMSRDASINLWDDINTENMLYHLQPVFNFNEDNETRPIFTPLALVIDPEEPEDQREDYHAIHFYEKNGFQYVAFGLSINEWTQYDNNVYAIIDKIGEMIKAGKSLDSKLEGIVEPKITDNGDGSANVMNNNLNADTYYVVYNKSEYEALKDAETGVVAVPNANDIINGSVAGHTTFKANDTDFHTQKYTEKMYIFAASKLGADAMSKVVEGSVEGNSIRYVIRENEDPEAQGAVAKYPFDLNVNGGTFNMPYNQSWKKDGYTVTAWEVTKSSDPARVGTTIKPGDEVSGLTQDITVKAVWTENTHKITDLSSAENKTQRTVTWEFLQSKGAPALALENKAGNMQAVLVGQVHFNVYDEEGHKTGEEFIDVPMTINTDNLATLPDNGTEYHGKFNNTSVNWAKSLTDGDKEYTGSDYAQVRTGTQFTFPMVYGSNVVYKGVELVEAVNGVANGNVNRSQISQSYITDGSKTADALNYWRLSNPGFKLDPGWTGEEGNKVLQPNSKIDMTGGVAQLATTSPTYEKFKESMGAMGYDNILYDEDNEHHAIGGNFNYGGLIYYNGEATEATLTSVESAQYVNVGATTGKTLGGLNYGSVFMQSLSVTYPALYDLTCTWNPAKSELDPDENPGKIEKLNDPRPNCGGRYVLYDDINLKLTPAYGYYVDVDNDEVRPGDVVTKEAYYFLMDGNHSGQALNLVGATSKVYRYKDADYASYSEEIKANIPEDGAYITMKVMDIDLVVSMKKWPTVKYKVEAYPSTQGYITFNTGNGRPHEEEYEEFPVGKTIYVTAHPNTGYKFKEWRRNNGTGEILVSQDEYDALVGDKTGYMVIPTGVTKGDGDMQNPFDPTDFLEKDEMMFTVSEDNNDFTYVAVFEEGKTGTAHYEFEHALLQTSKNQDHKDMTKLEITAEDKNKFPTEASSKALNIPYYYTLFKPGYTLDHWVEIEDDHETNEQDHTPADHVYGKSYRIGTFYYYATEGEVKHLVPVFTKNTTSYDYRATPVDITWDLRVAENAQRMTFKPGVDGTTATTKIYYSTHAKINNGVLIDVPLTITLGKKGKLVNDIEEEDKWCAMGEGTQIEIPSGLGAKFTIASLSKMETTTIDGVVPTSYTVEKIDDADVYLYTYTTTSEATSVTLKIGDDYSYYKYIRAELPSADAVPLTVTENNAAFGTVEIAKVRTTADAVDVNNTELLAKINDTKESVTVGGVEGDQYTLGLGTIVSLHAKRSHLYVLDHFEDGDGNKYYYNKDDETKHLTVKDKDGKDITAAATAVDEYLKMEKVQDFNTVTSHSDIQLTFQVQSYSESMHAVFKENTLYQVNYTSGDEAEGEAPGMTLIEDGEAFTVPAENHHLYLDGQTLRYWMDEDGNKYDLGQSYILGQTFTASKDLPSGITSGSGFTVPKKDIFLTPVFKVNDFTVMNLDATATAKWPLSRKGGASYEGNGDIVINFEGINGIYVTPLKLENGDFIDLKMDIRGENGKANNVNSTDRCQINSGTVFGLPSSNNCTFTLKSANSSISAKIDGTAVEGQQTVSKDYTGDKTQIDVQFTGNTYLYEVVAQYKPVTTDLPELDYATVGNISLGALGTPLASVKLSKLKNDGEVSGVPADLSNSTTGIMPVVRGTATRGGYVDVIQATIDNPVATMLVKTRDGVTVSVYKIGFTITYPTQAPKVTDLKIDRKFQCDLKKMYEDAKENLDIDGTNYLNDDKYLRHLGVEGDNAANERVAINGVINIKFSTKMAETLLPATIFDANGTGEALGQAVSALEGQTLTFTYKGLKVNTEYDFIIPRGTFKDVFYAESTTDEQREAHTYNEDIRLHFTTVETAIATDRRVINYVVTHNQASHFNVEQAKMVADGEAVQVASDELIKNLEAAGIEHGTLDRGVELANAYKESGKRFYIFVPDGEYQLMGNDFVKSVSSPIGEDGKVISALDGKTNVYSGITTVSHDNVSITGQSQEKTIVYNHPVFEGLSNASTLKLNGGIANFYAQDMTLQNRFDFLRCRKVASKGVAPALWDRSSKPIFKNVKFDSYQDTYYTNANNQLDDTRGYAEDCTIMGYVDFICGDGDQWFQNCNMVVRQGVGSTATNMFAPRQYDTQKWGYVMNKCTFSAENNTAFDVNNGKMTIARPWANSPAETLIECKYDVLSTDDGYKKMNGGGLILRMQEYKSYNSDGTILDLSKRSLRNSTPGIGSYDAVMTPSKAAEYNLFDVMGGEDGYDPTLYTALVNMPKDGIKQDDTSLTWNDQTEALCYFIFRKDNESDTNWKLFAVTADTEFEMDDNQLNKWFCVRAANQRGGLGMPTDAFQYKAHESYRRQLVDNNQVIDGWRWSTIYLDFDAKAPIVQHEKVDNSGNPLVDSEGNTVMEDDIFVYALVKVDATKLTFKRVKTMEKNCGYLIKARPRPEEYEFKYTEKTPVYHNDMTVADYVKYRNEHKEKDSDPDIQMPHMSLMNGSVTDRSATGIAGYTLASKVSYGLGFYKFVGKTYNANYAWLDAALVAEAQKALADGSLDSQAAKAGFMKMVFEDDGMEDESATDIDGIRNHQYGENDVIYNLSGQRIDASMLQPGQIYIVGGKKFRYQIR